MPAQVARRPSNADGETVVSTGLLYRDGAPVAVVVRRRGRRVDVDDGAAAVELAGRPSGWRDVAESLVARDGFNVNRRGVIFVPLTADRDIAELALRLAGCSRSVYLSLLETR